MAGVLNGYGVGGVGDEIPEELQDEYQKVKSRLQIARSKFLKSKVLYTSLHNVIENARLGFETELQEDQVEEINQRVMRAEMEYCVQNISSMNCPQSDKLSPETENALASAMQKDLKRTCAELLEAYDHRSKDSYPNTKVFEARAMKIGEILEEDRKKLDFYTHERKIVEKQEQEAFSLCVKELLQCAEAVKNILARFKLKLQPKLDDETLKNLISRCETVGLKAANMTWSLRKELYNKKSIPALKVIHKELMKVKKEKSQEIASIEQQLKDFEILGEEFNAIVKEYNLLLIKIDRRKWTVQRFDDETPS